MAKMFAFSILQPSFNTITAIGALKLDSRPLAMKIRVALNPNGVVHLTASSVLSPLFVNQEFVTDFHQLVRHSRQIINGYVFQHFTDPLR